MPQKEGNCWPEIGFDEGCDLSTTRRIESRKGVRNWLFRRKMGCVNTSQEACTERKPAKGGGGRAVKVLLATGRNLVRI